MSENSKVNLEKRGRSSDFDNTEVQEYERRRKQLTVQTLSRYFYDLLQAQCVTKNKPRVFLGKLAETESVKAVKGPLRADNANKLLVSQKLKDIFDLPSPNSRVFPCEGANGIFVMSDCVGLMEPYDVNKTRKQTTRVEIDAILSNNPIEFWDHSRISDSSEEGRKLSLSFLLQLAFRKVVGTNDTHPKNFIIDRPQNIVISIDDAAYFKDTKFMFKSNLKQKHSEYEAVLTLHWTSIIATLSTWVHQLENLTADEKAELFRLGVVAKNIEYSRSMAIKLCDRVNWEFKEDT